MALPKAKTLKVVQGQAKNFLFTFKNKDGTAFDLTGKTVRMDVKDSEKDEDVLISKTSADTAQIEVLVPETDGQARFKFVPADTNERTPGNYVYDVWIDQGGGNEIPVTAISTLTIAPRVTVLT